MDAAVDDAGAARARELSDLVSAQRVAGVDADADDIARHDRGRIERIQRLVDDERVAVSAGVAAARTYSQRGVITAVPKESRWG